MSIFGGIWKSLGRKIARQGDLARIEHLRKLEKRISKLEKPVDPGASKDGNEQLVTNLTFKQYSVIDAFSLKDYFSQVEVGYANNSNPFTYYMRLIDELRQLSGIEIVPVCDLMNTFESGSPKIAIRHDVDADPLTAIRCARYLAKHGVPSAFYILHSALYYGRYSNGCFMRNPEVREWVEALIVAGCEIGMHNDAIGVCQEHGVNGAESLVEELGYLRAIGANIQGTCAHNSFPIHGGSANSEIFKERVLGEPTQKNFPIGVLSEKDLDLSYEATFAVPKVDREVYDLKKKWDTSMKSEDWLRTFLLDNPVHDYSIDFQAWMLGNDEWCIAGKHEGKETFETGVNLLSVIEFLKKLPASTRTLIVIHPCYVRL